MSDARNTVGGSSSSSNADNAAVIDSATGFTSIDTFYSAFIPCLALFEALRTTLSKADVTKVFQAHHGTTAHASSVHYELRGFLDALAILCDIPYNGDSCTAIAISGADNSRVYLAANTTAQAQLAQAFVCGVFRLLRSQKDEAMLRSELHSLRSQYERDCIGSARRGRHEFGTWCEWDRKQVVKILAVLIKFPALDNDQQIERIVFAATAWPMLCNAVAEKVRVISQPQNPGIGNVSGPQRSPTAVLHDIHHRLRGDMEYMHIRSPIFFSNV